ncbi:MAG: rod shape-determining protein MreC [Bacteroidetes bacterium]|jgi:rod shape-determining protein MreC|nr:rod shape-determining protein MreC [Bacteroidota bacterium]
MRNLAVFVIRNYFFLLFLFLEILSVYFIVQRNYFQHTSAVSAANWFTGSIYQARTDFSEYLDLKEQNKILSTKLADQLSKQNSSWMFYSAHGTIYNDTIYKQRYEYLPAEVIDNTVTLRNNYIILNRGKLQGVLPDMGVVCGQGVVGIVREVSDNYCVVMSILHSDTKISASLKKDGSFGKLTWDGGSYQYATLADLPDFSKIAKGDTLISSGLGDAFPEGVPVGVVKSFEFKPGEKTYSVEVKLGTDFRKLRHAFIVKSLMRVELDELRKKAGVENGK